MGGDGAKGPTHSFVMKFTKSHHIITAPTRKRGLLWTAQLHLSGIFHLPPACLRTCPCTRVFMTTVCHRYCSPFSREDTKVERLSHPARAAGTGGFLVSPGTAALPRKKGHGGDSSPRKGAP